MSPPFFKDWAINVILIFPHKRIQLVLGIVRTYPVKNISRGAILSSMFIIHSQLKMDTALPKGSILRGAEDRYGGGQG